MGLFRSIGRALTDVKNLAVQVYSTPVIGAMLPGGAVISPALMAYNAMRTQGSMGSTTTIGATIPKQPTYQMPAMQTAEPGTAGQMLRRSSRRPRRQKMQRRYKPRRRNY